MLLVVAGYVMVFSLFDTHSRLYAFSKEIASYEYRQYLGNSKRYLPQYLHMLFLFLILVVSRYVFLSNNGQGRFDSLLKVAVKY